MITRKSLLKIWLNSDTILSCHSKTIHASSFIKGGRANLFTKKSKNNFGVLYTSLLRITKCFLPRM